MIAKLIASVAIATALAGSSSALAHRLEGTGGKVRVTGWGRSTIDASLMEVRGKLRLGSIRPDDVAVQCRVRIRTNEGVQGVTRSEGPMSTYGLRKAVGAAVT
jgi:hypothetical protein